MKKLKYYVLSLFGLMFIVAFYYISNWNYLIFHTIIELFTLLIGVSIFIVSLLSRKFKKFHLTTILGAGVLISTSIVFIHAITYRGMNIIIGYDANLPTQLWIIANYIQAFTFLTAVMLIKVEYNFKAIFLSIIIISVSLVTLVFTRVFPTCFVEGVGLTPFKIISEYLIVFIYLITAFILHKKREHIDKYLSSSILLAIVFFIFGELLFTLYTDVYGLTNFFGHVVRFIGFIVMFNSFFLRTISNPLDTIFFELSSKIKAVKKSEDLVDEFFQQSLTGFFIMELDEPVDWNESIDKEETLDYIFDHQRCTRVNQAMLDQYDFKLEDFLQKTPRETFAHNIDHAKNAWRQMLDNKSLHTLTDERKSDGAQMFIEGDYICLYDSLGRVIGHFGNQQDVTLRIQKQKKIEFISNHDYLTDLYNRRYYFEQFRQHDKLEYYPLGIMMIDVNGLKIINDAFGHAVGDIAIKKIGKVLKDTFEKNDIVSRIGGDEFAVLLPKTSLKELQKYKEQIISTIKDIRVESIELSLAIGFDLKNSLEEDNDDILKFAENHMYRHKSIIGANSRGNAINAILETLTNKYENERMHSERVSYLCKLIGKKLKLKEEDIKGLEQAGLFHDIGKISIPDNIIDKPGKLTDEEYDIIKTHPEIGYQILRAADEYSDLAIHALHHHERWDGKGYPSGLKGNDIPLFSRIIGIADAYEAMTADRPYRKKLSKEYAISEIMKYSGTQFDPKIAKIFLEKVVTELNEK